MKLCAISDLHLGYEGNRKALLEFPTRPDDWLIVAGDIGETLGHLKLAFDVLNAKYRQIVWVPGNHELWSLPSSESQTRGQDRYQELVDLCRQHNVLTPEDAYRVVDVEGAIVRIVPLFLLYDYSFRPANIPLEGAVAWAGGDGVYCSDELLLHSDPYRSVPEWCHARCQITEMRLMGCNDGVPNVLINHFPLRRDLVELPLIPRFSIWCGTDLTHDWHIRFNASIVVSGHLHIRSTKYRDGVRFEEVSLGYPHQWQGRIAPNQRVRELLPCK